MLSQIGHTCRIEHNIFNDPGIWVLVIISYILPHIKHAICDMHMRYDALKHITRLATEFLRDHEQRPPHHHRAGGAQRRRVRPALPPQPVLRRRRRRDGHGGRPPQLRERLDAVAHDDVTFGGLDKDPDPFLALRRHLQDQHLSVRHQAAAAS